MKHRHANHRIAGRLLPLVAATSLALAAGFSGEAAAQTTTATLRGETAPNAEITAVNTRTGATRTTRSNANGDYVLSGVVPGEYQITASSDGEVAGRNIRLQIGQVATLDLPLAAATQERELEAIEVRAQRLVEMRTNEVATNVSQEQIESLPQGERNFLAFAALAPGVAVPRDQLSNKSFTAHGQIANQTNVFIDGVNLKNNVIQGGLVGQDSSKGNPFSQEAVQEFRVLTQNYKAEYEQAGSALITAITKSGTNEFHGSLYGYLQTRGMVETEHFVEERDQEEPEHRREQFGATLGGPIVEDVLQFFVSYEGRRDDTATSVFFNNPDFAEYNGNFQRPFEQDVFFGKLSWHPNQNNDVDLTITRRDDSEIIGFGGTTAYTARASRDNWVDGEVIKWSFYGERFVNEMTLDHNEYLWTPNPVETDLIAQDFQGTGRVGGATNLQEKGQESWTLRDDITFNAIEWNGLHTFKTGIKIARYDYTLLQNNLSNPLYIYNRDRPTGYEIPFQAQYAPVGQFAEFDNMQYGVYFQDDWDVTDRFQLNLGLRWDYEDNSLNNDYVTPQDWIDVIEELGISEDYISTGEEREGYKDAFQPRLGFNWDISAEGDGSRTLFGGAGRYYDRTPFDHYIQEAFRSQYPNYTIWFSEDGSPVDGNPAFAWDPRYLTVEGLNDLIEGENIGGGEINLVNNNTKPPYSDQFSLGMRQVMGNWVGTVTLSRVEGHRQFTYIWGNRDEDGTFIPPSNGYGPVLLSDYREFESNGLYASLDKPYTEESGWGVGIAYTYLDATKTGGDAYSLDWSRPELYPDNQVGEKHRVVINGIVDLPWDMKLTGLVELGTGEPYTVIESFDFNGVPGGGIHLGAQEPEGYDFIIPNAWAYRRVDLSLSKTFRWGESQGIEVRVDALNVFDHDNFSCYEGFTQSDRFGEPSCTVGTPRAYQIGLRYEF